MAYVICNHLSFFWLQYFQTQKGTGLCPGVGSDVFKSHQRFTMRRFSFLEKSHQGTFQLEKRKKWKNSVLADFVNLVNNEIEIIFHDAIL